ncbi:MAG: TetR/AcrR family transcriptional regulator [Oscillibacter sp.]|jgi:AcrR family transcriptional regulator|nr:TetR/AcrR family transcriptional regulator [Oscillibacter sp.]
MSRISEQRRREILTAATAEFTVRGIERASMSDIAVRAGVGKSTIYEYFPSKGELFAEVCKIKMQEMSACIHTVFQEKASFRSQLVSYCSLMLECLEGIDMGQIFTIILHTPEVQDLKKHARQLMGDAARQVVLAIQAAQASGELSPQLDVDDAAAYLIFLPNPHLIGDLKRANRSHPVELIVDLALNGLTRSAPARN